MHLKNKFTKTQDKVRECALEEIPSIGIERGLYLIVKGRYLRSVKHSDSEYTVFICCKKKKLPMTYYGAIEEEHPVGQHIEAFGRVTKVKGVRRFICYSMK
ncbi:hypothetical protein NEMIN01_2144 [Nematocida minor]|uniref:uncharacterized protein n=1 Tax=Nematocida minor TaxID=1912983 RepID=UPI00221F63A1|nr:uncharacterized protein NEMIN01_2144 [Nematocida minor]KAI5192677.1 hypothetical protein NEMIN01_2144 [Nematocida minor]